MMLRRPFLLCAESFCLSSVSNSGWNERRDAMLSAAHLTTGERDSAAQVRLSEAAAVPFTSTLRAASKSKCDLRALNLYPLQT